ncbi:MAG: glycogen/starch/alpha-glucan phosphorylase, partial [Firmicutes bacterium]|nr:glycogen/starch/alpha-glucan phosphorylase [Bacillota bacterium]
NVEIAEQVGMDNIKIFGLRSEEIDQFRRDGSYLSWDTYSSDPRLKNVVNQLVDGTYDRLSGSFHLIYDNLMRNNDEFFVLKDFNAYVDAWKELEALYSDKTAWGKISATNTACSGFFSSDRTIEEYVSDIWHLDK